jgi:hypothetical protein
LSSNLTLRFRRSLMPADTCNAEVTKRGGADADWELESLSDIYPELFQSDHNTYYSCLRIDDQEEESSDSSCFTRLPDLDCSAYQIWEQEDEEVVDSFLHPISISSVCTEGIVNDMRYGGLFLESDMEHACSLQQQNLLQTAPEFALGETAARENIGRCCRTEFAIARNAYFEQRENLRSVTPVASSQLSLAVAGDAQNAASGRHAATDEIMESLSTETFVESCLVAVSPSASSSLEQQPPAAAKCPMISHSSESSSRASSNTSALHKLPPPAAARSVDEAHQHHRGNNNNKRTRKRLVLKKKAAAVDAIADTCDSDSKHLAANGKHTKTSSSAAVTYQDTTATMYIATRQREKTDQQEAGASSSSSLQRSRDHVNENKSLAKKKARKGKRHHRNGTRLPAAAVAMLQDWTAANCTVDSAYPSKEVKTELAESTGLHFSQVSNWLSCWRDKHNLQRQMRNLKAMVAIAGGTSTRAQLKTMATAGGTSTRAQLRR